MNQNLKSSIESIAQRLFPQIQSIRHHLHKHPELSFKEVKTSQYIQSILEKNYIDYTHGWAGTGIIARIGNDPSKKTLALRADIDALPILEENNVSYKSQNEGVMHACGHDVHTSCVIGALLIINELKDQLTNNVVFIFQPGEEKLPGGASLMLKESALGDILPDAIIGQHVHPPLAQGSVGIKSGMYMASADEIYVTIKGKGGHAALPQNCIDTILMAAEVVTGLQKIVSRYSNPTTPSVLTIGKINSVGGATNIIPDIVKLEGTFRTMDEEWRNKAHSIIESTINGIVSSMGGSCDIDIKKGYPFLKNHEGLTEKVKIKMVEYLGQQFVVDLPIRMTAEDFSYYTQVMPGCFYRLGTGNIAKNITSPVHTPTFDIDEDSLFTGMGLMAYLAFTLDV